MVRYLVTGAAGFIGSHLIEALLEQPDADVRAIDNFSTGIKANIEPFLDRISFFNEDITNEKILRDIMQGVDYVLHQAALPSVPRSISEPTASNWNNINGTLNVLVSAKDAGVKRVVFASSSSVYGTNPALPKREDQATIPFSPYALTKLTGEHYCRIFSSLFNIETVCLRYFNVFGPRQNPDSQYSAVIPLFVSKLLKHEKPVIYGDGEQSRDFTYISNVVSANLKACTATNASGKVFNIGCGEQFSVNELFSFIQKELGSTLDAVYASGRPGDVKHSLADISLASRILGYSPMVSVRDGLSKTVAYYKNLNR